MSNRILLAADQLGMMLEQRLLIDTRVYAVATFALFGLAALGQWIVL
jgi:hypothetical protein